MAGVMPLLTVNAGSSSTKVSVLGDDDAVLSHLDLPHPSDPEVPRAIGELIEEFNPAASVHRIVHGGPRLHGAVIVDASVESEIAALGDLAPLHNPPGLALLDHVRRQSPLLPAVACFDTAYFGALPEEASTYAVPLEWRQRFGIRRYGFHGLSHESAARRMSDLIGRRPEPLRVVSAHLGSGCSLAAIDGGRPVDTTMGFTPLEGLVMATRSGTVDPGALTTVMRLGALTAEELDDALETQSGLLALAGSGDLALVLQRSLQGDKEAELASSVYVHRRGGGIASRAAAIGGFDALLFTGGAGEGSAPLRAATCERLGWLGVRLDPTRNEKGSGDRLITGDRLPVVAVITAREDLEMARQARLVLR